MKTAVKRGMDFIASAQAADGGFTSFSSPVRSPFQSKLTYQTTFAPALILSAISSLDGGHAQTVRRKLADWLLAQKSPHWSFNYWAVSAPQRKTLPYPDDLDDTFCALIALHRHDPSLIDETALAGAVKLLLATESQVGGPYRTWLTGTDAPRVWQDIDLAVNANVAAFLRLVAEPLPNLTQLMEQAIATRSFHSPYYPSVYPAIYYIARSYDGPHAPDLADFLLSKRRGGWWGSPLPTALAATSLVRLGRTDACSEALEHLLASQRPDGSWPAEAFCIDPAIQNKTHYNGSAALTTAFAVEALDAFRPTTPRPRTAPASTAGKTADTLHKKITAHMQQEVRSLSPALRLQTQTALRRIQAIDANHEIALLPYFFNQSLVSPLPTTPLALFTHLGAANLYGWTAYTIYDDFLDGEGDPLALSAANTALRYSVQHFWRALPGDTGFQTYTASVFDAVDGANAWELTRCRMPVSGKTISITKPPRYMRTLDLANRSLGHTLTPLAILAVSGISPLDPRARHISLALRHYIAARQLNDDLHDWEQDLRAGIITYVVARLLQELSVTLGTYPFTKLIPKLQQQFWHHTLPDVCTTITRHTTASRTAAAQSGALKPDNIIAKLTQKIDQSVEHTLSEQTKAEAFLAAYKN